MARIKTYQNDSTLSGLDRLTGIDSATGSVRNFTLDSLAQFLAQSGNADGSRLGFNFEYGGVYDEDADNFIEGNIYIEFLSDTPASDRGFANISKLYFKNEDANGSDFVPVRSRLEGAILKITNTSTAGERAYGLYTVREAGTYDGSANDTELQLTYIASDGEAGFDNFTISLFGSSGSGGGGDAVYNGFIAGARTPIQTEGVQGDIFFDTDAKTYYRKLSATDWGSPTSLDGPQGTKGDPGNFNNALVGTVDVADSEADANVEITIDADAGTATFDFDLPPGAEGPIGPTLGIGSVNTTTGSAGTDASVTISKSGDNANFTFVIPRGEKGSTGSGSTIEVDGPSDYENDAATTIAFEGSGVSVAGSGSTATVTITDSDQFANQQELENFITNKSDFRTDIGAGTSNLVLGTTSATALAGNTRVITDAEIQNISNNTAKLTANTANVQSALGISGSGNNALFLTQQGNFVAASGGGSYTLPIAGTDLGGVQVFNNSDIAISNTGAISIKSASVTNAKLTSGAATDGQVLTANGSGGTAWEDVPGGTTIVANPGGTDGDTLTRITIGEDNYNIGGGDSTVSINGTTITNPDFITENSPGGITVANEASGIELTVNSKLNASSNATDGYVLTSDGSGGVAWEMAPGAGSGTVVSINGGSDLSSAELKDNDAAGGINVSESGGDVEFVIHSSPSGSNATDGHVLTADGSGGVAWEAVSGGGSGGLDEYATGTAYSADDVIWNDSDDKIYVVTAAITASNNTAFSDLTTTELSATPAKLITWEGKIDTSGDVEDGLRIVRSSSSVSPFLNLQQGNSLGDGGAVNWINTSSGSEVVNGRIFVDSDDDMTISAEGDISFQTERTTDSPKTPLTLDGDDVLVSGPIKHIGDTDTEIGFASNGTIRLRADNQVVFDATSTDVDLDVRLRLLSYAGSDAYPSTGNARGQIAYDSTLNNIIHYNGSSWVTVGTGDGGGGLDKYATGVAYEADDVIWNDTDDKIYVVTAAITASANTAFSDLTTDELSGYTLPVAANATLGGVIVETGSEIDVDSDGKLTLGDISIDADEVTTGTFADARIPDLAASKITSGEFATSRIPGLDAAKITSGTFVTSRIPDLDATKITTGEFAVARIPNLTAVKITDFDTEVTNNTSVTANTAKLTANATNVTAALVAATSISDSDKGTIQSNIEAQEEIQFQDGGSNVSSAGAIGTINFTGDVAVTESGGVLTIHIADSNTPTPPTISLAQSGFDADSQPSVNQTITFTATVVANDATITNVVFSSSDSKFSNVTDTTSPYSTQQTFNFTGDGEVVVTATLNYTLDGSAATLTDTVTMTIAKENPEWSPDYTYSDFNVTPNDTNIEAFDTGDIEVSDDLDGSNNNGWDIDGTETYSPTLNSDREFSVTSAATDVALTVTSSWDSTGSGGEELNNYEIVDHTWNRIRSLRTGGKANTTPFTATALQNVSNFTDDIEFETTSPAGKITLHREGGEYLYFAYDSTLNDVDLEASTQAGFPINDTWVKEAGTPAGFKVYRNTSIGGSISKTDGFSLNIVLQS